MQKKQLSLNKKNSIGHNDEQKIVIITVGLPASGKTFLCQKLCRFLNWIGVESKIFSTASYRNMVQQKDQNTEEDFFNPYLKSSSDLRTECGILAFNDLEKYLNEIGGQVAILDSPNITFNRRFWFKYLVQKHIPNAYIMFLETIITDIDKRDIHIKHNLINNPVYQIFDHGKEAVEQYKQKVIKHFKAYETVQDFEGSYMKIINCGQRFYVNEVHGYLQAKIVSFIMNLNENQQTVYFSRHGQSNYNVQNRIGGDSDLSENGIKYSKMLGDFFQNNIEKEKFQNIKVLTSTLKRTIQTASHLKQNFQVIHMKCLDEINAGICDGLTYQEIEEKYPYVYRERKKDKLRFSYPRGESYLDIINRIEPVIIEIERSKDPVIIISHQAVLRCIYAYFTNNQEQIFDQIPQIQIPLHTVFQISPNVYQTKEKQFSFNIENQTILESQIKDLELISKDKQFILW